MAEESGASLIAQATTTSGSLKAALDCDWDDPEERSLALVGVLDALEAVESYLFSEGSTREKEGGAFGQSPSPSEAGIDLARRVREQDVWEEEDGGRPVLRRGVARERLVSVEDPHMRHGRKSRSVRFSGYKRHVLRDLDTGLVRAVGLTPANAPEASVSGGIARDLAYQDDAELKELHIDRAYLSSSLVKERPAELEVYCKAWRVTNGERFPKTEFALDWERGLMRCPAGVVMPFEAGGVVRFPKKRCAACPLRERCTKSRTAGRSVSVHPDERLLAELRERQSTPEGRKKLSGRQLKFVDTSRPLSTERRGLGRRRVVSRYINELANGTTKGAGRRGALLSAHRALAGLPSPLRGRAQEPLRPQTLGGRAQPARDRPHDARCAAGSRRMTTRPVL